MKKFLIFILLLFLPAMCLDASEKLYDPHARLKSVASLVAAGGFAYLGWRLQKKARELREESDDGKGNDLRKSRLCKIGCIASYLGAIFCGAYGFSKSYDALTLEERLRKILDEDGNMMMDDGELMNKVRSMSEGNSFIRAALIKMLRERSNEVRGGLELKHKNDQGRLAEKLQKIEYFEGVVTDINNHLRDEN